MAAKVNKTIDELTVADLKSSSVWEYTNEEGARGEIELRPLGSAPVTTLQGRLVATQVRLADGSLNWALLGNVDVESPRLTKHFLTLSILGEAWFTLARYHDRSLEEQGPEALARFLGKTTLETVFPISYDISGVCSVDSDSLRGSIKQEPDERLSRRELIRLAVQ